MDTGSEALTHALSSESDQHGLTACGSAATSCVSAERAVDGHRPETELRGSPSWPSHGRSRRSQSPVALIAHGSLIAAALQSTLLHSGTLGVNGFGGWSA